MRGLTQVLLDQGVLQFLCTLIEMHQHLQAIHAGRLRFLVEFVERLHHLFMSGKCIAHGQFVHPHRGRLEAAQGIGRRGCFFRPNGRKSNIPEFHQTQLEINDLISKLRARFKLPSSFIAPVKAGILASRQV